MTKTYVIVSWHTQRNVLLLMMGEPIIMAVVSETCRGAVTDFMTEMGTSIPWVGMARAKAWEQSRSGVQG